MNEIAKQEATALTAYGERDPFAAYADSVRPSYIIGKLLKFSKGDYLLGEDNEPIEIGTVVTAAVDQLLVGWIRWESGKPTEHRMVLVASRQAPPRRHELGDADRTVWELGSDGEQRDPWAYSAYLPLLSADGELWTFTTSSRGGHGAIGTLSRAYANHRRKAPDDLPLISLEVDSYQHSNREYGRIKVPVFEVTGWEPKDRFITALGEAGLAPVEPEPLPPIEKDLNDSIPF